MLELGAADEAPGDNEIIVGKSGSQICSGFDPQTLYTLKITEAPKIISVT